MEYRPFGKLEQKVSVVGFGGASISGEGGGYGFGKIEEKEAIRLLHMAKDAGINLFDTAPVYGFGLSEIRMGKAFKGIREEVVLISKSGVTWDEKRNSRVDNSPEVTLEMLHNSLRNLQTDYIDVFFIHWPDSNVDIRKPMEVLARAKEQGKIRAIGLSNSYLDDMRKASEIERIDVLQNGFHLFQDYPKRELFQWIRENEAGFMGYGTLDKGILTGRVDEKRNFESDDVRSRAAWWTNEDRSPKYKAMAEIKPVLEKWGYSLLEMALGYVLHHSEVSCALCGVRNEKQLETALEAVQRALPEALIREVKEIADHYVKQ